MNELKNQSIIICPAIVHVAEQQPRIKTKKLKDLENFFHWCNLCKKGVILYAIVKKDIKTGIELNIIKANPDHTYRFVKWNSYPMWNDSQWICGIPEVEVLS